MIGSVSLFTSLRFFFAKDKSYFSSLFHSLPYIFHPFLFFLTSLKNRPSGPLSVLFFPSPLPYHSPFLLPSFPSQITSVADPDPVGSGLFGSPGSGSGKIPDPVIRIVYPQKDPCNSNFPGLVIKLSKIKFCPNNFLSLILSVIGYLDLVRKCHKKYIFC